jgi:exonuclease VII small subunit
MENQAQKLPQGRVANLNDIQKDIIDFVNSENKVLILSSLDFNLRDFWLKKSLEVSADRPIQKWAHSSRIAKLIENRTGIEVKSIYQTIYGRPAKVDASETQETEELEDSELQNSELKEIAVKDGLEIVPIKSDKDLPLNTVFIIPEAHLISSTKIQNDILNFGTGCLLNDLLFHLEIEKNNRKLILIGDPYLISFGKHSETALNVEHVASIFNGKILALAHQCELNTTNISLKQRAQLAQCIDKNIYNNLNYYWNQHFTEISKDEVKAKMIEWFNGSSMASNCVLVYTNGEASRINKWVKSHILKNSEEINVGDLLLTQNNVYIFDESILESSKNIYNGTFLKVLEVIGPLEPIIFEKVNVKLEYLKLRVKVLKGMESNELVVNVLLNYLNQDELSKEQHIALRILASTKYYDLKKKYVFKESIYYKNAVSEDNYKEAVTELDRLIQAQNNGEKRLKTAIHKQQNIIKKLLKKASQKLDESLKRKVVREDEFVNALHVRHGWAMTVHKSIGFQFDEVIFKADSESFTGYHNRNYFSWVYSGLSASSKIYLSNPKRISAIDGCKFEDIANVEPISTNQLQKKSKLVFIDYVLPQSLKEKSGDDYNANVMACISELTSSFVHFGALLEQIDKKDNYLYKAIFSLQDALSTNLTVAVNNNGKGEVSSVRIEKCPDNLKNQVQQVIDKLFEMTPISATEDTVDGFRLRLINEWKEKASTYNLNIVVLKCHSYLDFLKIEDGKNHAKFKMTYNASGFITGITVVNKTEDRIVNQLKKIIFDEY